MTTITKPKLLFLIIGIAITAVSLGLGAWTVSIMTQEGNGSEDNNN